MKDGHALYTFNEDYYLHQFSVNALQQANTTIEDIAEHYVYDMLTYASVSLNKPIVIAGWSSGGNHCICHGSAAEKEKIYSIPPYV